MRPDLVTYVSVGDIRGHEVTVSGLGVSLSLLIGFFMAGGVIELCLERGGVDDGPATGTSSDLTFLECAGRKCSLFRLMTPPFSFSTM